MNSETASTPSNDEGSAIGATSDTHTRFTGFKPGQLKPVDRRKATWEQTVSEAEAKAAARLLLGALVENPKYNFAGIEDLAAYNVLKKWSGQK